MLITCSVGVVISLVTKRAFTHDDQFANVCILIVMCKQSNSLLVTRGQIDKNQTRLILLI